MKDHWYHAQILRNVWPEVMKPYRDQMELLSDGLGNRHDLDVLGPLVVDGNDYDDRVLRGLIEARAGELTERAIRIGSPIYAEPARNVAARYTSYWDAWVPATSLTS